MADTLALEQDPVDKESGARECITGLTSKPLADVLLASQLCVRVSFIIFLGQETNVVYLPAISEVYWPCSIVRVEDTHSSLLWAKV